VQVKFLSVINYSSIEYYSVLTKPYSVDNLCISVFIFADNCLYSHFLIILLRKTSYFCDAAKYS